MSGGEFIQGALLVHLVLHVVSACHTMVMGTSIPILSTPFVPFRSFFFVCCLLLSTPLSSVFYVPFCPALFLSVFLVPETVSGRFDHRLFHQSCRGEGKEGGGEWKIYVRVVVVNFESYITAEQRVVVMILMSGLSLLSVSSLCVSLCLSLSPSTMSLLQFPLGEDRREESDARAAIHRHHVNQTVPVTQMHIDTSYELHIT